MNAILSILVSILFAFFGKVPDYEETSFFDWQYGKPIVYRGQAFGPSQRVEIGEEAGE